MTVRHDEARGMFVATLDGAAAGAASSGSPSPSSSSSRPASPSATEAHLVYKLVPGETTVVDMVSTRVPDAFRGKGVAGLLADAGFAWAKGKGYKVRGTCSYISDSYVPKHPEVKAMVVE